MKHFRNSNSSLRYGVVLGAVLLLVLVLVANDEAIQRTSFAQHDYESSVVSDESIQILADYGDPFNRNVVLYTNLLSAEETELYRLLDDARNIEHISVRRETLFAIAGRLADINPNAALRVAIERDATERVPLIEGIISEWSVKDLDSAIEATKTLDRDLRLAVLKTIAKVRDDLSTVNLRAIARALGHPDHEAHMENESEISKLGGDPIAAWRILVNDGLDNASQLDNLIVVAEMAIEQMGLDALFHLRASFASDIEYNEMYFRTNGLFGEVVDALVSNHAQSTWEYIQSGFSEAVHQRTQSEQSEFTSVSERNHAFMTDVVQQLLLKSWAVVDPKTVIDRIEQVPYHLQPLACERALGELAKTEPERAVELIPILKRLGSGKPSTIYRIIEQWSLTDSSNALTWVQSSPEVEEDSRKDLVRLVLYSLVLQDPIKALEVASAQTNFTRLEALVIRELALNDLDTAIELLPNVSRTARRLSTLWAADIAIEQGEVDQALKLVQAFDESSDEEVSWFTFFLTWSDENPIQLFERLDDFPPKLKYAAAHALDYYSKPELTEEQLEYVRTISKQPTSK